jgi:N-methylhydantoinase A
MQSSGGIIPANAAAREPVRTILSGPAGGVVGALTVAKAAGFERILTFDMGGTSTDVALVNSATGLRTSTEFQIMGMPIAVPMLDIHTVGAGGGSLAMFDRGGALKVGPESAGADPGPICYGRGEQPTVTDANLLAGRLDADSFLGGAMKLDEARSREFTERAKGKLENVFDFAEGIIRLADVHMERALRKISVEQGHDPRDFTLVSFGGAGPLHACELARALKTPKVLVPNMPGALSAYGILVSDVIRDYSRTLMLKPGDTSIRSHFEALEAQGQRNMEAQKITAVAARSLDLRYAGQGYELPVPWSDDFVAHFHRTHEQRYGYADPQRQIEVVNARVRMIAATQPVEFTRRELQPGDARQALVREKLIYYGGEWLKGAVYHREALHPGDRFAGPAVVVEYSATTFLPPGCSVFIDTYSNLVIEVLQ